MWNSLLSTSRQAIRTTRHIQPARSFWASTTTTPQRAFSVTTRISKQSEDFDREALQPDRSEMTKSGTDSEIAQHETAYDPSKTAPESELEATEQESKQTGKSGTLNMSGANKDVNKWRGPQEGGPDRNVDRGVSSTRGTPNKRRAIHVKEDGTHVSYRD